MLNPFGMLVNGLVHKGETVLSATDFFFLVEGLCVDSDSVMLASKVELLIGDGGYFLF